VSTGLALDLLVKQKRLAQDGSPPLHARPVSLHWVAFHPLDQFALSTPCVETSEAIQDPFLALAFWPLWSMVNLGRDHMLVIFRPKHSVVIQI
jgi:hypothetical protein